MMLGLFKEEEESLTHEGLIHRSREILISYLNKGIVPSWEQYFKELPLMNDAQDLEIIKNNFYKLTEWTFLREILIMDGTEYFFHHPHRSQVLTKRGEKESFKVPLTLEEWQLWLEIISIQFKQNWNVSCPFASFYGEINGLNFRLSLIHSSTSPQGLSKLVLRSLSPVAHPLESFGETEKLKEIVFNKSNLLIAGSTGSGKTSLLTTLLDDVNKDEHIVILEDTYEILNSHPHQTRFLAGETNETSLKSYLSYTLRLSPDRIILGEMRSHEVIPFLMAMNTELICRNMQYVVFMEHKKVKEVIKILGSEKGVPFYENVITDREEIFNF